MGLGGNEGEGGRGKERKREETLWVIQGRRYGLPAVVAKQQESCCVRSLCQIRRGRKKDTERRVSVRESAKGKLSG